MPHACFSILESGEVDMTGSRRSSAIELFSGYDWQQRRLRGTQYTVAAVTEAYPLSDRGVPIAPGLALAWAFQPCNPSLLNGTE